MGLDINTLFESDKDEKYESPLSANRLLNTVVQISILL